MVKIRSGIGEKILLAFAALGQHHFGFPVTGGTVVFKSKKHHISFAFGIGKHWGATFGTEYYESWDWHHFVIGFTIIKFFVAFKVNWRIFGEDYDRDEMYFEMYD